MHNGRQLQRRITTWSTTVLTIALALVVPQFACWATTDIGQAATRPIIEDVEAYDAPAGGKGGIKNTFVHCKDYRVEPRARMILRSEDRGWSRVFRWNGALPGTYFPRVWVGSYVVKTTAWCGDVKADRTERVSVVEKTAESTISRAEFDSVRRGMSPTDVVAIVGNPGRDRFKYDGEVGVTDDMMAFWAWAILTYRDGRLVAKFWDVGHD